MLESLLLSRDAEVFRICVQRSKSFDRRDVCRRRERQRDLDLRKVDAVFVDCDDLPGGTEFSRDALHFQQPQFRGIRDCERKKTTTQEAFGMGVNFVLQHRSRLNTSRCLNAALTSCYRAAPLLRIRPYAVGGGEKRIEGNKHDISEGGIAIAASGAAEEARHAPNLRCQIPASH